MVNQLTTTAAATSSVTGNATATAQAAQAFMKFSGISGEKPKEKDGEYQPTEEDGRLTVEMAEVARREYWSMRRAQREWGSTEERLCIDEGAG